MKFAGLLGVGVALVAVSATVVGCGGGEGVGMGDLSEKSAAEKFCDALSSYVAGCGPKSPCDDGLVKDCADVTAILSDSYLRAAAACVEEGAQPVGCLATSIGAIEPSDAHREFGSAFCSDCALGVPGCEELLFGGGEGEVQAVGQLLLPLGDELVREVIDSCMGGLTCLPKFPSCVQTVIAKRAIPEATLACLLDPPPASTEPAADCPDEGAAGTSGGSGSGSGATGSGSSSSGTSGSSGTTPNAHVCSYQTTFDACYDCCIEEQQADYSQLLTFVLNECSCEIASPCNGLCPDLCTGGAEFTEQCQQCINDEVGKGKDSACTQSAVDECVADDVGCKPFFECTTQCPDQ